MIYTPICNEHEAKGYKHDLQVNVKLNNLSWKQLPVANMVNCFFAVEVTFHFQSKSSDDRHYPVCIFLFLGRINFLTADGTKFSHPLHHIDKSEKVRTELFFWIEHQKEFILSPSDCLSPILLYFLAIWNDHTMLNPESYSLRELAKSRSIKSSAQCFLSVDGDSVCPSFLQSDLLALQAGQRHICFPDAQDLYNSFGT